MSVPVHIRNDFFLSFCDVSGTAAAVAPRSGGFGRTALVATVGAAAVGLAAVGAMAAVNSFRSSGPPVRGMAQPLLGSVKLLGKSEFSW